MSEDLESLIQSELDRLGTQLASQRMSAGDTRLWALATLTEAAYCLRAVRAAGLMPESEILVILCDASEIVFSEPARPVQIIRGHYGPEQEGKPN